MREKRRCTFARFEERVCERESDEACEREDEEGEELALLSVSEVFHSTRSKPEHTCSS